MTRLGVVVETGSQKTFASAYEWPGWSRSGKTVDAALERLIAYQDRYVEVARLAGLELPDTDDVVVLDEQPGDATTNFGVPRVVHAVDHEPMDEPECERHLALLKASWDYFEQVSASVSPELRKGPRGGGRDRDKIIDHVVMADRGYARKIDVKTPPFDAFDRAAVYEHHAAVYAAIPPLRSGELTAPNGWPLRYALRRMAWHVLDHAWEMQDKDLSGE